MILGGDPFLDGFYNKKLYFHNQLTPIDENLMRKVTTQIMVNTNAS